MGGVILEIQLWREILSPYEQAVDELLIKFNHIIAQYRNQGLYSPIETVTGRVKKISSILDKMQKKNIPMDQIVEEMDDIAGIRVMCQFVEDIDKVVEIIRDRSDMRIREEKDYITNAKDSGYQSYHIILDYDVYTINGPKTIQAEIQIRTLAMNFWATIEHSLQYKYKHNMPSHIREKLHAAADATVTLDKEMSQVRGEIMDAQNSFNIKANIVSEILTNIQNLYRVGNQREIVKIQDEFYKIYQQDDMELLGSFAKQLDIIAEGYKAQSLN
ncbi:MAG: GTP pyrophosphokinase family protein [Coprococcus sp.]|nr:GTP pyrophosphokinase family protein [Coprococcus sp.]